MTINEIQGQLIGYFLSSDHFNLEEDFTKIYLSENKEEDEKLLPLKKEVIKKAFLGLETSEIVSRIEIKNTQTISWFLIKPINSFTQTVSISPQLAYNISSTINSFIDASEMIVTEKSDPLKITEDDIVNLLNICHITLESEDEESNNE